MDCKFTSAFALLLLSLMSILFEFTKAEELESDLPIDGSELVDKVLELVREAIIANNMDPMVLPSERFELDNNSITLRRGRVRGFSNIDRVGPVGISIGLDAIKFRSAYSVYDITIDQDVIIKTTTANFPNAHIKVGFDNITMFQVFQIDFVGLSLNLEEFELGVGDLTLELTGFGQTAEKGSTLFTAIANKIKNPLLKIFNTTFKTLVNAGLEAIKNVLVNALKIAALALVG